MGLGWTIVALIAVLAVAWRFLGSSGCRSRSPLSRHTTSASGSKTPPAAAPGSASRSLPRNSPPRRSNRLPQVLIVDDDPDLLNVCRVGLGALGHAVRTAETADDGLSETAITRPDVIVLDLGLPDLDGVEVCKRIRTWSDVPIIVLELAVPRCPACVAAAASRPCLLRRGFRLCLLPRDGAGGELRHPGHDQPELEARNGSLQPGGSVPDVRVLACDPGAPADSGPRAIWLHELLSPSRLNLLLAGESYSAVAPSAWLGQLQPWRELISVHQVTPVRDPEEQFRFYRAFGDGQSLVLVRPDLYVSFAGGQQALPHLLTWLNTWFPPAPGGDRHVRRRQLAGRLRRV